MKIKPWYITVIIFFITYAMNAQDRDTIQQNLTFSRHSLYIELLGAGIMYSVNYEYQLKETEKIKLSARMGINPYLNLRFIDFDPFLEKPLGQAIQHVFISGITLVYKGKKKNKDTRRYFEQGIYPTWFLYGIREYDNKTFFISSLFLNINLIGFRWESKENGFYYKINVGAMQNLFYLYYNDFFMLPKYPLPVVGGSVGYRFQRNKKTH